MVKRDIKSLLFYLTIFQTNSKNAKIAAHSVLSWVSLFVIRRYFASDQSTAWNNSLIKAVADKLKMIIILLVLELVGVLVLKNELIHLLEICFALSLRIVT